MLGAFVAPLALPLAVVMATMSPVPLLVAAKLRELIKEAEGWLRSQAEGGAKERKNYRITPAGRKLLKQLRSEVEELYRELVLGEEPEHTNEI